LATMPLLLLLYRYLRGDRQLAPQSPFGKGVLVALTLLWVTVTGYLHHDIMTGPHVGGLLLLWVPAAVATWLLMSYVPSAQYATVPGPPGAAPSDPKWRVGRRYWMLWGLIPLFILAIAGLSTAMQEGPLTGMGRKRFGPDAYWRQTARLMGTWRVVGQVRGLEDTNIRQDSLPLVSLQFGPNRDVTATMPGGAIDNTSQWFLKNQYTWLRWRATSAAGRQSVEVPLEFRGSRLYIAGLPIRDADGYLVLERVDE
jgi:hypothetical protein